MWKALRELGIHPDIITGTSVGALNGALMVQDSYGTAVRLWENLNTTSVFDFPKEPDFFAYTKAFLTQGGVCRQGLETLIQKHLQEDIIRTSPITLGMMLARKEDLFPCPVFTEDVPQGMLCDYLMATTACFPAAKCHTISGVDYIDGGYCDNLPVALAKAKGANRIIAVSLDTWDAKEKPFSKDRSVMPIYPRWNLGNWLIFRKENTNRNIRLGYLDTLKAFGVYEGNSFTFQKGTFHELYQKKQISASRWKRFLQSEVLLPDNFSAEEILKVSAELAGKLLKISPYCVYTVDSFLKAIHRKISCQRTIPPGTVPSTDPEEKLARIFLAAFAGGVWYC